jgi:quercetin dioxygenase-like cupin family protein
MRIFCNFERSAINIPQGEANMARNVAIILTTMILAGSAFAQEPGIQRKPVIQQDGPPGYRTVVNVLEFAPGSREVRHTHPGPLAGYVLEGTFTLECEGQTTVTYKAGDAFYVEAGKAHLGSNEASMPLKLLATLFVERDKPLINPAP